MAIQEAPSSEMSFPQVQFSPRRLGHANVFVSDAKRSVAFYRDVAGLEEVYWIDRSKAGFVSNGRTHHDLGLVQTTTAAKIGNDGEPLPSNGRAANPGLNHLGWEMENLSGLVAAYGRLTAGGHTVHRCVDHQLSKSVYLFDPDGFLHEIYADTIRDWRGFFAGEAGRQVTGSWRPDTSATTTERFYDPTPVIRHVPNSSIHPEGFSHVVLMTRDYDAMVAYYTGVHGLRPVYESPESDFVCLAGSAPDYHFDVALFRQSNGAMPAVHHYGFKLASESELSAAIERLTRNGHTVERRIESSMKRSFYLRDPDGALCEFHTLGTPAFGAVVKAVPNERPYLV
jgi:catechol 2,3-dioxygenase